jgi:hypothetical protein
MGIFVPVLVEAEQWDAETISKRTVFFRVGRLCRRVQWTTGTMRDLQIMVCREFGAPEDLVLLRANQNDTNPFIFFHSEFSKGYVEAAPLVWPDADLKNGSVVSVRDPLWQAVLMLCAGEGEALRRKRASARAEMNLAPLTPIPLNAATVPTEFSTEASTGRGARRAASASAASASASSSASDAGWGRAAADSPIASAAASVRGSVEDSRVFGSSDGSEDASRRRSLPGTLGRYLSHFSSSFSAAPRGVSAAPKRFRIGESFGDAPVEVTSLLAKRAALLSNLDDLRTRERVDVLLNDPHSSLAAAAISSAIMALITVSTATFCLETLPWLYSPEASFSDPFWVIEASCVVAFTCEFALRVWATDDRARFFARGMNLIDLIAIAPFYVDVIARGMTVPGLSVLRALRLARVFRMLRVSKNAVAVLGETMRRSARPLYMLVFLLSVTLVAFSAAMYYAERGEYDFARRVWMRAVGYECDVPCGADDVLMLTSGFLACGGDLPGSEPSRATASAYFHRLPPTVESVAHTCAPVFEQSPFQSIVHSMWRAMATLGTVGYGDLTPQSVPGWILSSIAQLLGILVIALPITVIGSNFSAVYASAGTTQSLSAKARAPCAAANPRRLHASAAGATASRLTDGWVGPSQYEWDLDVCYEALLPCRAPELVPERRGEDADVPSERFSKPLGPRSSGRFPRRRNLTAEEQLEAFVNGEDLFEDSKPDRSSSGNSPSASTREASAEPSNGEASKREDPREDPRPGARSLRSAVPHSDPRNLEPEKNRTTVNTDNKKKADEALMETKDSRRVRFVPPAWSRRSGEARRAALCVLAETLLSDCVRNAEMRDKFAATRYRESLARGDSFFSQASNSASTTAGKHPVVWRKSSPSGEGSRLRVVEPNRKRD